MSMHEGTSNRMRTLGPCAQHPKIYSREYYQRLFETEDRHWWHLGMREIATALVRSELVPGRFASVLDAGCGSGSGLTWAERFLDSGRIIGIDIASEALRFCRSRPGRKVAQASVLQLPFRADSFDLLISQDVLQHLPTDDSDLLALREMYRVLRMGGLLLVRSNSRLGMWQKETDRDNDFQRYTLPELVSRLEAAGFMVARATYANALPALYASLKRCLKFRFGRRERQGRLYEGLPGGDSGYRPAWLNGLLFGILKAEAFYLSKAGRRLSFGHTTYCLGIKSGPETSGKRGMHKLD